MHQFVIDQGNTLTKIAVFENHQMTSQVTLSDEGLLMALSDMMLLKKPSAVILSSVREDDVQLQSLIAASSRLIILNHQLKLPFTFSYATPETIGGDRLANAAGAIAKYGKGNCLIVDCGTCITYTLVLAADLKGGTIAPGLEMRYKALHHFTGKLPEIHAEYHLPQLVGIDTEQSMRSGVELAIIAETDALITQYCSHYSDLNVLITGGNSRFFENHLKSPIFAAPYITLEGLYEILQLNHL